MIRDRLYAQIAERLNAELDHEAFERTAAALLEPDYPTLVPVSGGRDAGQEGITAGPDAIILVSTTSGDAERNLRKNLDSHIQAGRPARRAIFATNRHLPEGPRNHLRDVAAELGFQLLQVYAHDWFTGALHRKPFWRTELLAISGDAPALSTIPPSRWPALQIPLIGRNAETDWLREATGDGVIIGTPGVGKSAILRELVASDWGLFLVNDDLHGVPDDIREFSPARIIVDDAHFSIGSLEGLRRMRTDMGEAFDIVAVSWPGERAIEVQTCLPDCWRAELLELSRGEILEIIRRVGVEGSEELQAVLINQAHGRPGLAVTLALMAIKGHVRDVASGEALFNQTQVISRNMAGDQSSTVLAAIALAGSIGIDMERIRSFLGLDLDSVRRTVNSLASGGIIGDSGYHMLVLLPEELRFAVVKEMYFGGPSSLPVSTALTHLPLPSSAVIPLVGAAHRGAPVPDNVLQHALESATDRESWAAYATLGEAQARLAVEQMPEHALHIAARAVPNATQFAFRVVLDKAAAEGRALDANGHPLKEIAEWLNRPEDGIHYRQQLGSTAQAWCLEGGDLTTALEAIQLALDPSFERLTTDPGEGRSVNIRRGVWLLPALQALSRLFDVAIELTSLRPARSYAPLIRAIEDWCYPGRMAAGVEIPAELTDYTRRRAAQIAEQVVGQTDHAGLRTKLARLSAKVGLGLTIPEDSEFAVLFPEFYRRALGVGGYEQAMTAAISAAESYGESLAVIPPEEAIDRLATVLKRAGEVGETELTYVAAAARKLASLSDTPGPYVVAACRTRIDPAVLQPFVAAAGQSGPEGAEMLRLLLEDEVYWCMAALISLTHEVPKNLVDRAIGRCDQYLVNALIGPIVRDEVPADNLRLLLRHEDSSIAMQVASIIDPADRSSWLDLMADWENAVVRAPLDETHHPMIFGRRPDLLERWIRGWVDQGVDPLAYTWFQAESRPMISQLSRKIRVALIEDIGRREDNQFDGLVRALIAEDIELAGLIFKRDGLKAYEAVALAGEVTPEWLGLARLALANAWASGDIVRRIGGLYTSWQGSEAAHYERLVEDFDRLPVNDEESRIIVNAGKTYYGQRRDQAAREERRQAVFGIA